MDLLPWFATFAVSLLVGLQFGVLVGFIISVIFLLYWAARPGIRVKRGQVSAYHNSRNPLSLLQKPLESM